ncbi:MAG: hypothetical protein CM15mP44_9100 [Candidatus Neomarinimicrobiota bacterium]|nr:MAG: hypothetical protein CM15mP44_9100 [Candidatus Neomarinimicrobiota bacterium]
MELTSPVSTINGLGPARVKILNEKDIFTCSDILYYFPRKHLDRTTINSINKLVKGNRLLNCLQVETFGENQ